MFISEGCRYPSPLRAVEQPKLHQIRFVDLLDGVLLLAERGRESVQTDWPSAVFVNDREEEIAIDFIQPVLVHTEHLKRFFRHTGSNFSSGAHFSEIADAPQKPVRNARSPAAAARNFLGAGIIHRNLQNAS